jgi:hypothetical protein
MRAFNPRGLGRATRRIDSGIYRVTRKVTIEQSWIPSLSHNTLSDKICSNSPVVRVVIRVCLRAQFYEVSECSEMLRR